MSFCYNTYIKQTQPSGQKETEMNNQIDSVKTNKIARIWEVKGGFIVADWDNELLTNKVFKSDAEAAQYTKDMGYEEVIWME